MRDWLRGTRTMAGITMVEALRSRAWLLLVLATVVVLAAVPRLRAANPADGLRLSVAVVTGTISFAVVMFALQGGIAPVRRDLEQRCMLSLLSKPLPRSAYVAGRWLGTLALLACAVVALDLVGTLSIRLQVGRLVAPMITRAPESGWVVRSGQALPLPPTAERVILAGRLDAGHGEAVRWQFTDLPSGASELSLLLRAQVTGIDLAHQIERTPVSVSAIAADGRSQRLRLDPASPYGQATGPSDMPEPIQLAGRSERRRDFGRDYARLQVPGALVRDGRLTVQIDRLRSEARLFFHRESSVLIATRVGSFLGNVLRAGAITLAAAGLLAACGLFLVTVARMGVALLGGLTMLFGGHLLSYAESELLAGAEGPVARALALLVRLMPDFARYPVEANLAASRHIGWGMVADAWVYYGIFIAVFLGAAMLAMRRLET
ncbi:MAG: ABC transporter permease subunit [Planctomycetota bacterium]